MHKKDPLLEKLPALHAAHEDDPTVEQVAQTEDPLADDVPAAHAGTVLAERPGADAPQALQKAGLVKWKARTRRVVMQY